MAAAIAISQGHIQISKTAARDGMKKRKHDLQRVVAVSFPISHNPSLKPPNSSQLVVLTSLEKVNGAKNIGMKQRT